MTYTDIAGTDTLSASRAPINTGIKVVENLSYGPTAPSSPVTGERWIDSNAPAKLKWWDGSSWITLIPDLTATAGGLAALTGATFTAVTGGVAATGSAHFPIKSQIDGRERIVPVPLGGLSASRSLAVAVIPSTNKVTVSAAYIVSDTSTSGSDGSNRWDFQIANLTAANNLLSVATTTNGAEITADTAYALGVDQNNAPGDLDALDVIELQITKTGTPTDLSSAQVTLVLVLKEQL